MRRAAPGAIAALAATAALAAAGVAARTHASAGQPPAQPPVVEVPPVLDIATLPSQPGLQQDWAPPHENVAYDGRFTFARIRFTPQGAWGWYEGGPDVKWHHDFPRAERNFMRIVRELTTMRPFEGGGNVFRLDDPELMKYPVAYLCEAGYWAPTDAEAAALRAYLAKGGFIIFDDFFGRAWENFQAQLRRVLPEGRLVRLDPSHPIFDAFYHIEAEAPAGGGFGGFGRRGSPEFWGVFEDNDPSKRLLMIVNYNNDLGEGWEWSDEAGMMPLDVTSTDFKLGVNYLVYGMTH